jgi:hypothetical protein
MPTDGLGRTLDDGSLAGVVHGVVAPCSCTSTPSDGVSPQGALTCLCLSLVAQDVTSTEELISMATAARLHNTPQAMPMARFVKSVTTVTMMMAVASHHLTLRSPCATRTQNYISEGAGEPAGVILAYRCMPVRYGMAWCVYARGLQVSPGGGMGSFKRR